LAVFTWHFKISQPLDIHIHMQVTSLQKGDQVNLSLKFLIRNKFHMILCTLSFVICEHHLQVKSCKAKATAEKANKI